MYKMSHTVISGIQQKLNQLQKMVARNLFTALFSCVRYFNNGNAIPMHSNSFSSHAFPFKMTLLPITLNTHQLTI